MFFFHHTSEKKVIFFSGGVFSATTKFYVLKIGILFKLYVFSKHFENSGQMGCLTHFFKGPKWQNSLKMAFLMVVLFQADFHGKSENFLKKSVFHLCSNDSKMRFIVRKSTPNTAFKSSNA